MLLDQQEQGEITKLLKNEVLLRAIEKVILQPIYKHGVLNDKDEAYPAINFALHTRDSQGNPMSNEKLGELVQAKSIAIGLLIDGVKELAKYKVVKIETKDKKNKAR